MKPSAATLRTFACYHGLLELQVASVKVTTTNPQATAEDAWNACQTPDVLLDFLEWVEYPEELLKGLNKTLLDSVEDNFSIRKLRFSTRAKALCSEDPKALEVEQARAIRECVDFQRVDNFLSDWEKTPELVSSKFNGFLWASNTR